MGDAQAGGAVVELRRSAEAASLISSIAG
jgi:hypothetical protein